MKKLKISNYIIILVLLFISTNIFGYLYLIETIKTNHIKQQEILIYKIKSLPDNLSEDRVSRLLEEEQRRLDLKAYLIPNNTQRNSLLLNIENLSLNSNISISQSFINNIIHNKILMNVFHKDKNQYRAYYFIKNSVVLNNAQVLFSLVFDENELTTKINTINFIIITLIGITFLMIFLLLKIRNKEVMLFNKDMFIKHSIHEIKTPLSIISLNNQLRKKFIGEDEYSHKIDSGIKILKTSFEDISYLLSKSNIQYEKEIIILSEIVEERVKYFESIVESQGRQIKYSFDPSKVLVSISRTELTRLIDNNLSNAIKYSKINSTIIIKIEKCSLKFYTQGKIILNKENIFKNFVRENKKEEGLGLGLSIVEDICKKYNITKRVISEKDTNIFEYNFNCHIIDIE